MNKKVYINPTFNRMPPGVFPLTTNNKMHVNPKFSQHNMLQNNCNRIYVNPHFVKPNVSCTISETKFCYDGNSDILRKEPLLPTTYVSENISQSIACKSRYSLVRHHSNRVVPNQECVKAVTVKINKYKSVAMSDYKKNFVVKAPQQAPNKLLPAKEQVFFPLDKKFSISKRKENLQNVSGQNYCKNNIRLRFKLRNTPPDAIRSVSISSQFKTKVKRNLKKNNIPCPLYKKYGKCLRRIHGTCDFLHDKKHVSVCRKFMKGICHDKGCLLSHEITSKKMPTCYFYLRGMCTKENCPYVHVKLNEKTKLCPEFLKGYCENGDECLDRHIQVTEKIKGAKQDLHSLKNSKTKQRNVIKHKITHTKYLNKSSPITTNNEVPNKSSHSDTRYYKERQSANSTAESEVLKPLRCKLGTLPSFIKLSD